MRLASSAILALITATAPVFSAKIANPLTIEVVTSWEEGIIAGYSLWDLTTNRARVDAGIYQRVESFGPFEKEVFGVNFGVQRNVEDDHYYIVSFSSLSTRKQLTCFSVPPPSSKIRGFPPSSWSLRVRMINLPTRPAVGMRRRYH